MWKWIWYCVVQLYVKETDPQGIMSPYTSHEISFTNNVFLTLWIKFNTQEQNANYSECKLNAYEL